MHKLFQRLDNQCHILRLYNTFQHLDCDIAYCPFFDYEMSVR